MAKSNDVEWKKISKIAKKLGLSKSDLYAYGPYMAKVLPPVWKKPSKGKLILVTAMTPTPAGEGKTTMAIGLADGLNRVLKKSGKVAVAALRQPSLGPVFGMKGGATGGGKSQVGPSDDININFTGDIHALTAANALVNAIVENSIYFGNPLAVDPERIVFPRAEDMNDRGLRHIRVGIDRKNPDGFDESYVITAASELMAIFCLAEGEKDFLTKANRIIVAYDRSGKPLTIKDFGIGPALLKILKLALHPNLVQSRAGSPVFVHGGPFANIAHGCCSIVSLKAGLGLADYCVTEAGFAGDLGAEKFMDILCPRYGLAPDLIVVAASIRSLLFQGGGDLSLGIPNLLQHLSNMARYSGNVLCCLHPFPTDTKDQIAMVKAAVEESGFAFVTNSSYDKGAKGAVAFAKKAMALAERPNGFHPLVEPGDDLIEAMGKIAVSIYHADGVSLSPRAKEQLAEIEAMKIPGLSVCFAKTPLSFSDDPKLKGVPKGFVIHVDEIRLAAGSKFVIPVCGKTILMPGLPKEPAALKM